MATVLICDWVTSTATGFDWLRDAISGCLDWWKAALVAHFVFTGPSCAKLHFNKSSIFGGFQLVGFSPQSRFSLIAAVLGVILAESSLVRICGGFPVALAFC